MTITATNACNTATENLIMAAATGDSTGCQVALDEGADINGTGTIGVPALALAAGALSESTVGLLLANGANPSAKDCTLERTALHWVALEGASGRNPSSVRKVAKLLLLGGVPVAERDALSKTAAAIAASAHQFDLAQLLSSAFSEPPIQEQAAQSKSTILTPQPSFNLEALCVWIVGSTVSALVTELLHAGRPLCMVVRCDWARDYELPILRAIADGVNKSTGVVCRETRLQSRISAVGSDRRASVFSDVRSEILGAIGSGLPTIMLCSDSFTLDPTVSELVGFEATIPRFTTDRLKQAVSLLCNLSSPPFFPCEDWIQFVGPTDLLAIASVDGPNLVNALSDQVKRRISALQPACRAISLSSLHGLGIAKQWAQDLIADMQSAQDGAIPWDQVDRGALLDGPPGVGKTTIARAIACEAGTRLVATTVTAWQSTGNLSDVLLAMEKDFERAAELSPCILFIDEIDAIGSRSQASNSGNNDQWVTWSVNHLLALMDGFSKHRKVVVLGASNHAEKVDPALRRSGRLDRLIKIPLPNRQALEAIYSHYLKDKSHEITLEEVGEIAQCSIGVSGADVERFVREASRRARTRNRMMQHADLLESLYGSIPVDQRSPMQPEEMKATAWHEAGHAVMLWSGSDNAMQLNYLSIVPRSDGVLGFMAFGQNDGRTSMNRAQFMQRLAVLMAGRAAEEVAFGVDIISSGCASDLATATQLARTAIGQLGLGSAGRLSVNTISAEALADEVERELQSAYKAALETLNQHKALLDRLAHVLMERSEISRLDFERLVHAYLAQCAGKEWQHD